MTRGRQLPALSLWLLENCPEVVRKLERSGLLVLVGDSKKLDLPDIKLIVPDGIEVFDVLWDYRSKAQFFFCARAGDKMNPGYLSLVETRQGILDYARNTAKLLYYPWFNRDDSSFIFDRLVNGKRNAPIYAKTPRTERHPLLGN
ncbi:hypothetical protein J4218_01060 [Candidatus Pacearchaeota archaeon]|nr:hypothetical protein [Candidatus Pacearchaeota archaeon]